MQDVQDQQKVCVLDIEIEGVKQLRDSDLNPLLVFIMPPSIDELEKRLTQRNTETAESLQKRLNKATSEIAYGLCACSSVHCLCLTYLFFFFPLQSICSGQTPGNFHCIVENHDLRQAYKDLSDYIVGELEAQLNQGVSVNLTRIPASCN